MPQWDLREFLAGKANRYSNFTLLQSTKVTCLIIDDYRFVDPTWPGEVDTSTAERSALI